MASYFESQNDAKNVSTGKEMAKIVQKTVQRQKKQNAKEEQALGLKEKNSKRALLPAYSEEADTIEEFYDLNSIISPEEMEALSPKELDTLLKKPKVFPKIHSYVRFLIKQVEVKEGELSKREAQMMLYLNHMLMLYELKREIRGEVSQISERWKIPEIIVKNLLEKFTETGVDLKSKKVKYVKGPEQQHKLVHFIIVLALFIQDFQLDPSALAKGLAIKFKTLCIYLQRANCKPVHQISKKVEDGFGPYTVARLMLPPQ